MPISNLALLGIMLALMGGNLALAAVIAARSEDWLERRAQRAHAK